MDHDKMVNLSDEHRAVANGDNVIFDNHAFDQFGSPKSDKSDTLTSDERLV